MHATDLTVSRWRRYGRDRLYVTAPDGAKVGWWDLTTDEGYPEAPEHQDALTAAVETWKASQSTSVPSDGTPPPAPAERDSGDSASGLAGEPVPARHHPESYAAQPVTEPATRDIPVEPACPWVDLATNRPGAEAREQAIAARDAAPVKTGLPPDRLTPYL